MRGLFDPPISEISLRDYQKDVISEARTQLRNGAQRLVIVAPTGAGKTIIAAKIMENTSMNGYKSIFLADRRKLIDQASQKLSDYGIDHGIIMAGRKPDPDAPVQVASIQTLYQRGIKNDALALPNVQQIIIDEAHKSLGSMYEELVNEIYPHAYLLGFTATPIRTDGRGLGEMYDGIVEAPSAKKLTEMGFLVPMKYYAPSKPDMDYLKTIYNAQKGDYNERKLGKYMEQNQELIGDVVKHYKRIASGKKAIVFASSVRHSIYLRDAFLEAGIPAAHLDGETPQIHRDRIYTGLREGTIKVLVNRGVVIEGFDEPSVEVCILARPTKSLGVYIQMAGRVLRPHPGKTEAILIDHGGAVHELGFVAADRLWSLDSDETIQEREEEEKEKKDKDYELDPITCEQCGKIFTDSRKCPECGWIKPREPKAVGVVDGFLTEVSPREKDAIYRLEWYRRAIGYSLKYRKGDWHNVAYKLKFKENPPVEVTDPLPPNEELHNWNTHMIIRDKYRRKRGRR